MTATPAPRSVPVGVSERLLRDAATHQDRLRRFCTDLRIETDVEAVLLYLTHLLEDRGYRGASIRQVLRMLDAAAILAGTPAPGSHPHVRTFLKGMHQVAPLGPIKERCPLYLEDVHAILDQIDAEDADQRRDIALLHLANVIRVPIRALGALTWNDIRLRANRLEVRIGRRTPQRHYGPAGTLTVYAEQWPATVEAMRRYRRAVGPAHGTLFGCRDGPPNDMFLSRVLTPLRCDGAFQWSHPPLTEMDLGPAVEDLGKPRPRQLRDKAIHMLGWTACLTTTEAEALTIADVDVVHSGLLLRVPGRRHPVAVPASSRRHDPARIWTDWHSATVSAGVTHAFPAILRDRVLPRSNGLGSSQLSGVVQDRAALAGLVGEFSFTSLRIGFLRTALRARVPEDLVARQADLRVLGSVSRHTRRERLIADSVLHRVGL